MFKNIEPFLKSFGPGFITASVVLGPGSIAVSSSIGSSYGYTLLWLIVIAAVSMMTYVSMSARYGVTHKESILTTIANTYGRWFAVLIGIAAFITSSSFQFGNNLGVGLAMKEITGVNAVLWPVVFTGLAIILIFWTNNLYKVLEKIMMAMVIIMILAFFVNLFFVKPNLGQVAKGFIPASPLSGQLNKMTALVATTFALGGALYQSYLVQNKGWGAEDLKNGMRDAKTGIFMLALISSMILITSAAALHPLGIEVHSAADMIIQLENLFGEAAKYIFSVGLSAAAFSSLVVSPVIGAGLFSDGLGIGKSMNERMPKFIAAFILLLGMSIAVFFRGNTIYALILAQSTTLLGVPLIALGMILVLNNKKVMGKYRNNLIQNIFAVIGFILICTMVYFTYVRIVTTIGNL